MGVDRWRRAFWFVVSISLLAAVVVSGDLSGVMDRISSADTSLVLLALLVANVPVLLQSAMWRKMLHHGGIEMAYGKVLRYSFIGVFFNNITPAGYIGGQPVVAHLISRNEGRRYEEVLGYIVSADVFNFLPVFIIAGISLMVLYPLSVIPALVSLIAVYVYRDRLGIPSISTERFDWVMIRLRGFANAVELDKGSRKSVPFLMTLSIFSFTAEISSVYIVAFSLGFEVPFHLLVFIIPLSRIANYAPTPGGSGAFEFTFSSLFAVFTPLVYTEGVAVAVLYRTVTYYFGLGAGFISVNMLPGDNR